MRRAGTKELNTRKMINELVSGEMRKESPGTLGSALNSACYGTDPGWRMAMTGQHKVSNIPMSEYER